MIHLEQFVIINLGVNEKRCLSLEFKTPHKVDFVIVL